MKVTLGLKSVTLAFLRLRQEDHDEFEVSLGYRVGETISKQNTEEGDK